MSERRPYSTPIWVPELGLWVDDCHLFVRLEFSGFWTISARFWAVGLVGHPDPERHYGRRCQVLMARFNTWPAALRFARNLTNRRLMSRRLDEDPGVLGVGQDGDHATLG